jgi:hypothetical protein
VQIERIALRLRPRNAWEALDLGIALVRASGGRVYGAWLATYLPAALVVYALLWERPVLAWLVLWWLKPLFDRVILAMLSRSLFDEAPSVREVLSSPRQWLLGTRIFAALTWGRFDLARSFHLPVHQLERSRGKAGRQRVRLLDRDARGAAVWLTFQLFWVEIFLMIGTGLALALLVPVQVPIESILNSIVETVFLGGGGLAEGALAGSLLGTLAVSLIEPMYVAAGFTLYLQRRTMLEGWDIELRFRNLADRIAAAAPRMAATLAALALGCALVAGVVPDASAQAAPKSAAEEIKKVMAEPEFGKEQTRKSIKYVGPSWEPKESKRKSYDWEWLEVLVRFVSEAARFLAWTAGALALAVALYFLAKYLRLRAGGGNRKSRPDFLFGLDVRPESLPEDVAAAAAALAREGRTREALSLLYRGALVRFLDQGLEFLRGDTEGDCQRKVDRAAPTPTRDFFRRLVAAWQSLAYGHRTVGTDDVLALAGEWQRQFAPAAEGTR